LHISIRHADELESIPVTPKHESIVEKSMLKIEGVEKVFVKITDPCPLA
jgi:hypothetical protein